MASLIDVYTTLIRTLRSVLSVSVLEEVRLYLGGYEFTTPNSRMLQLWLFLHGNVEFPA